MIITYNDLEDKINDQKQKIRTELSNLTIPCPYCGEQYHRVAQHAKSAHGIEISTFKETHYYTTATGALANKIFSLYAPKKDRYIQQYIKETEDTFEAAYRTNDKENKWDRYLTQKKMIAHIRGTETYGGLFYPQKSKVLVFDIDSYKPINVDIGLDYYVRTKQMVNKGLKPKANLRMALEFVRIKYKRKEEEIKRSKRTVAFEPTYLILGALYESGIPPDSIHILHSGDKGFHVDLYFDKPVDIKKLVDFGRTIISKAKILAISDEFVDVEVELRPEGRNGRGVRFPLGIHLSTGEVMEYGKKNHTNFPPVDNQYEYLLSNTKRIEKELFLEQIYPKYSEEKRTKNTSYRTPEDLPASAPTDSSQQGGGSRWVSHNIGDAANNHRKCKHYSREELEKLYEEGLKEPGTRHNVMLGLAILFKQRGFSKAATFKKLLDFSKEKLNRYSKSNEEQIEKDIGQIVRYTYERDYHLAPEEDTKWLLTDSDIRRIANYPYLGLNERITLVFFFILIGCILFNSSG